MVPKNTEIMANMVRQKLVESGLNFNLSETPYAMTIMLRKSFVKEHQRARVCTDDAHDRTH